MLAYLISAYRDPQHLVRLIRALDEEADFYVHIDLNVDEAPFRKALAPLADRVCYVTRHRVSWGGWQQVEYQRELIRAALARRRPYTHLVCLSGQDYPLWSNRRIRHFFSENADRQLMSGYNLTAGDDERQRHKFTRLHPCRDLTWQSRWWKDKAVVLSRHLTALLGLRRSDHIRLGGRECPIYFGSDYWALTPACARYVLRQLEDEPGIAHYFRTTFVPSELCLQTLVFNSPFAAEADLHRGSYPGLTALTPLHYINYGAAIKVLTLDDMDTLHRSNKMFCRKVVSGTSDALADAIDHERAGQ